MIGMYACQHYIGFASLFSRPQPPLAVEALSYMYHFLQYHSVSGRGRTELRADVHEVVGHFSSAKISKICSGLNPSRAYGECRFMSRDSLVAGVSQSEFHLWLI